MDRLNSSVTVLMNPPLKVAAIKSTGADIVVSSCPPLGGPSGSHLGKGLVTPRRCQMDAILARKTAVMFLLPSPFIKYYFVLFGDRSTGHKFNLICPDPA